MRLQQFTTLGVATSLNLLVTQSQARNSTTNTTSSAEPCAQISAAAANKVLKLDAGVAMACLKSIPIDVEGDVEEIKGLKVLVQFQSDLAYLKDPPPGFLYPGVDVLGSLDAILADVQAGQYASDYDVQMDLYNLVTSTYDYHFNWIPDLVGTFTWSRERSLFSISSNGLNLPDVYDSIDVHALAASNSSDYRPSPVKKINDVDVEIWLNEFAALNPYDHDPDANYHNIFVNIPTAVLPRGGGRGSYQSGSIYQGNETVLKFANGTTKHVDTYATSSCPDFTNVTDGPSFFQQCIVVPSKSQKPSVTKRQESATPITTQNAYTPVPAMNLTLPEPSFYPQPPDTVVVSCPNLGPADNIESQSSFRSIFATAKSANKSKLIIDIRGNGGGTVIDGYDMFKQLFPSKTPFGASNLAASGLTNAIGEVFTYQHAIGNQSDADLGPLTDYDVTEDLTIPLADFASWSDFYGPIQRHGGNFTKVKRFNLTDAYSLGTPLYGYINDTQPQPQTFEPENIVILSDAFCGSTCAVFAELMKTQAGVHAIAVGGRKQYGPMQWVGGTKGAIDQKLSDVWEAAIQAAALATPAQQTLFEPYADLAQSVQHALSRLPSPDQGRVNFENNIRKGDDSVTPLQFVYEAADCRFFYTAAMITDQSLVWKRAYDLRWENDTCAQGSTGHPSSVTGPGSPYIEAYPSTGANSSFGANETFSFPGAYAYSSSVQPSDASTKTPQRATGSIGPSTAPTASQSVQPFIGAAPTSASISIVMSLVAAFAGLLVVV